MSETNYGVENFYDKEELTDNEYKEFRDKLKNLYDFYVMNPAYTEGVNYSLWINDGEYKYPIMESNTGGFTTFNSKHEHSGVDGIIPTNNFFKSVAYGTHEALCFTPTTYFETGQHEKTVDIFYEGKERDYEVWASAEIIHVLTMDSVDVPELEPLAQYADKHTNFMTIPYIQE